MTRRDIGWRVTGAALSLGGCAASMADRTDSLLTLLYFFMALMGLVLMVNGKRVAVVLRAERRGHGATASAIRAERIRHRRRTYHS